jgi:hypothetical protein
MIIRITNDLGKKIKNRPSRVLPPDDNPYADWTARLFTESRMQYIMITNTVCLYTMIMVGKGISDALVFTDRVTRYISEYTRDDGFESIFERYIAPTTATVFFSKALNRSVTGSMNDIEYQAKTIIYGGTASPRDASFTINEIPFSYLNYKHPREMFRVMKVTTAS